MYLELNPVCCGFQNPDLQSYDFRIQICKRCGRIACGWGCVDKWCVDR
ncbi:unnamed protein product [Brassica rapa subsp. narinosa]